MSKKNLKESGYDWIGSIPRSWSVSSLKRLLSEPLKYGANESGDTDDALFPRYIRITDFGKDGLLRDSTFKSLPPEKAADYMLKDGDVLLARSGATVGKAFYFKNYEGEACFAGYLIRARAHEGKLSDSYLYYFTQSVAYDSWKNSIFTQATIQNIGADKYAYLPISYPEFKEQTRIARYLDQTCVAIDRAIALKQQQLEKLDQLRKSFIYKAVTKGLDDSVEMRDSKVDWLQECPAHWSIRRIKDMASLRSGETITSDSISRTGEYPVFGGNGLRGYTTEFTHEGHYALIGRQGALCGNINYADGKFWASEHAVVVSEIEKWEVVWLGELLRAMNLNQYSNAAAQPGLSVDKIKFLQIPVPPLFEQKKIAKFILKKNIDISEVQDKISKQIEMLKEYKKSLIHECVTGKRRISETDIKKVA